MDYVKNLEDCFQIKKEVEGYYHPFPIQPFSFYIKREDENDLPRNTMSKETLGFIKIEDENDNHQMFSQTNSFQRKIDEDHVISPENDVTPSDESNGCVNINSEKFKGHSALNLSPTRYFNFDILEDHSLK